MNLMNTIERDNKHLDLLAIGHYVAAVIIALFSCMFIFHIVIGLNMISGDGGFFPVPPETSQHHRPPVLAGWMFFGMGTIFFILGQACAVATVIAGRFIKKRKNYMFSFVVGCISCAIPPMLTMLGVFSIIVLSRDSVRLMFGKKTSMDYPLQHQNTASAEQTLPGDN
jgi:hypothetical protein